jgi:hypothetical protein
MTLENKIEKKNIIYKIQNKNREKIYNLFGLNLVLIPLFLKT